MVDDPDAIFWSKKKVAEVTTLSEAEQERRRRRGTFPALIALCDDPNDPQGRVAYFKHEIVDWCHSRPRKPTPPMTTEDAP